MAEDKELVAARAFLVRYLLVIIGVAFLGLLFVLSPTRKREDSSAPTVSASKPTPGRGETGYLEVEGNDRVLVAVNDRAMDELNGYARAMNEDAVRLMVQQGRLLVCKRRTKVSVADPGFFSTTVLIMSGDHAGKTGIVPNEYLHK